MQRERFFPENALIQQLHGFLPEEMEQECLAIASGCCLLEVGEMRAL